MKIFGEELPVLLAPIAAEILFSKGRPVRGRPLEKRLKRKAGQNMKRQRHFIAPKKNRSK
ncbi:hypothetical protein CBW16_08210 [Flavobacteriaceae bacterium JJC]|nr:hypothetical protein CBW16_08210 [Flavobacteriaceae bacterium JJC]